MKKDRRRQMMKAVLSAGFLVLATGAAAYAAGGGGGEAHHDIDWKDFGYRLLNFAILAGFLWWLSAKKVKEFFAGRRADIKESLDQALAAKEEAERKYKEYVAKIEKATEEIDGIAEMIKVQGMAEKEKMIEEAKKAAAKIEEDTKARMEQEFSNARNQLRAEATQLSIQLAEELLKRNITITDHENMVKEYLDKVVIKH
ncbi:MAG TPA: ATP synthase F0 subunit B [Syntrophales bacterium]|jgi:F-type H+-transporting ATPase subunit b|nr:ATP synthase F0 subunit B [Syntrophales bacterium]HON23645.1 ATP synthase F0 subunit B [Syntrophales bacterium]HPC31853.1 ATP synthase F0 subunit B [Syntrophales bacterium]HRR46464.1 ATP synthase F0 subunit B [Syntrophales bacterium]HRU87532.1 ATP synthase F0 subunit B [Syntrophales bacterium]